MTHWRETGLLKEERGINMGQVKRKMVVNDRFFILYKLIFLVLNSDKRYVS